MNLSIPPIGKHDFEMADINFFREPDDVDMAEALEHLDFVLELLICFSLDVAPLFEREGALSPEESTLMLYGARLIARELPGRVSALRILQEALERNAASLEQFFAAGGDPARARIWHSHILDTAETKGLEAEYARLKERFAEMDKILPPRPLIDIKALLTARAKARRAVSHPATEKD